MDKTILKKIIINDNLTIKNAIKILNNTALQILLVTNTKNRFLGTLTDGDIRRALLNKFNLNDSIESIYSKKSFYVNNILTNEEAREIMISRELNHIPVIKRGKIEDLYTISKKEKKEIKNYFVIMAGGFGKRLHPVTKKIPKPMIKINKKPILEHIILRAKNYGFSNFIICTHYKYYKIVKYFGNGKKYGINISYVHEKSPMGTIGGLALLKKKISGSFVLSNADIISNINFEDILKYHKSHNSLMTVAVKNFYKNNQFGILDIQNNNVVSFEEKKISLNINAGIYVFQSKILNLIKKNKDIKNVTDLINLLINKGKNNIKAYNIFEFWSDVGTKKSLKKIKNKYVN